MSGTSWIIDTCSSWIYYVLIDVDVVRFCWLAEINMSRRKNVTSATTTSSTDARPAEDDIDGDVIINFAKVPTDSKSEHSSENWYREQAEAVPYKEIGFACLLFVMGSVSCRIIDSCQSGFITCA